MGLVDDVGGIVSSVWFPVGLAMVLLAGYVGFVRCGSNRRGRSRQLYEKRDYWDRRYRVCAQAAVNDFEWYACDDQLVGRVLELVERRETEQADGGAVPRKKARVLELGCGQSRLGLQLARAGYSVTSVDYSPVVVLQRRKELEAAASETGLSIAYQCVDATKMDEFDDNSFDIVVEKATFDSMVYNEGATAVALAEQVKAEVGRVLRPSGCLLSLSNASQEKWLRYWKSPFWTVSVTEVLTRALPDGTVMNLYVHLARREAR